jgi:hypothetical protein
MEEYRDKNVQVIYVPTDDYCGSVTYGAYKDGITCAAESFEYANRTYGIEDPFTELLSSRNTPWFFKVDSVNGSTGEWSKNYELHDTLKQAPRSDLFNFLMPFDHDLMIQGNFHKFITNSKGIPVASINNTVLNNDSLRPSNEIEILENKVLLNNKDITKLIEEHISLVELTKNDSRLTKVREILFDLGQDVVEKFADGIQYNIDEELLNFNRAKNLYKDIYEFRAARGLQDIQDFKDVIDEVLATDTCTHPRYKYNPYNE